jgi:1-deoxy-D-xylulose-5-phosphate reductoisomerase
LEHLREVTPDEACAHPNWIMGRKISVDSATMMNKGLEVIEARWLFDVAPERIEVLIHPQSVIHSMVSYVDGSVIAQLGNPDMRTPIAYALAYPARMTTPGKRLNLSEISQLTFEAPDPVRFPALRITRDALKAGGGAPTILNAANEVAVQSFLSRTIGFLDIARVVEETVSALNDTAIGTLEDILALDAQARRMAGELVRKVMAAQ